MRTKEEILEELAQAEKEVKETTNQLKALQQELSEASSLDLRSRFPHLTADTNGEVSGQLVMHNSITDALEKSLKYTFSSTSYNSGKPKISMWLSLKDYSGTKEIKITEKHLSFLNQLVKDANAALADESVSLFSKPIKYIEANWGGHDNG